MNLVVTYQVRSENFQEGVSSSKCFKKKNRKYSTATIMVTLVHNK